MQFELKQRSKVTLEIYGQSYEVSRPTIGLAKRMQEEIALVRSEGGDRNLALLIQFLSDLGLPAEVSESLEIDHFNQVVEFLLTPKKS